MRTMTSMKPSDHAHVARAWLTVHSSVCSVCVPPSAYLVHLWFLLNVLALSLSRFGIEGVWQGGAENRARSVTLQMFTPEMVSIQLGKYIGL